MQSLCCCNRCDSGISLTSARLVAVIVGVGMVRNTSCDEGKVLGIDLQDASHLDWYTNNGTEAGHHSGVGAGSLSKSGSVITSGGG